jgi:chitinase
MALLTRSYRGPLLMAMVLGLAASLVVAPDLSTPAWATTNSKYYRTLAETTHPDWMRWVSNQTSLGSISLPGTHDTLAIHGGDVVETQEDYGDSGATLAKQLDAGIRAIDIRVRVSDLANKVFAINHGTYDQHATYDDVLRVTGDFLAAHPTETVLMNVKAECTGGPFSCKDAEGTTNTDLVNIFNNYRDNNPYAKKYFWTPSFTNPGGADMPTLGQVRGKIVLRSFNGRMGGWFGYGLRQVAEHPEVYIQDDYDVPTVFDIPKKWDKVKAHFDKTNADPNSSNMYVNFTSGSSSWAYPYTVAGGTGTPDFSGGHGVNYYCIEHLLGANVTRTGVVMMDFPGGGLIDTIVAHNLANASWSSAVEADVNQMYQNIVYQAGGNAYDRANRFNTFLAHVAPQVHWSVGVIKQDYGYSIAYDANHLMMDSVLHDSYRFFFYITDQTDGGQTQADVRAVVDPALGGLSGDARTRASDLQGKLTARYPDTMWAVIVKADPGGFENWAVFHYGATSTYQTAQDGYGYLVYGIAGSRDSAINALDWDQSDPAAGTPGERVAYFTSWSIYANAYYLKTLDTNGTAAKLTKLNYAFENIDPVNLTCFAANKPSSSDENSTTDNDGSSDAWADYQRSFTAEQSVDGVADSWGNSLKGNFNQLKKLRAKYPNLRTLVSIGGWTYSKYFSDVAATDASRKKFVSSCIDMYIKGNLPKIGDDPAGGTGVAAGVFDGIDIDWEFPGSPDGHKGNHYSTADKANFTALLAEFRSQLNALGGTYLLTAALPSGPKKISNIEISNIAQYLDLGHIMTYDMHGAWEASGPTNFQAPLYDTALNPSTEPGLTANDAITTYLGNGFPASKTTLGVPFYARGWQGVPDNGAHGLYQSVTGATNPYPFSQQPGVAFYKELASDGKMTTANVFWDPVAKTTWVYDGTNFFGVETPKSLSAKRQYIKDKGLAGVMMYSLEADAPSTILLKAATNLA